MQPTTDPTQREILKLSEALLLCQRELAQVREAQEPLQEECSRLQMECIEARTTSENLARALADHLSQAFWQERQPIRWRRFIGSRWPWLKELFGRRRSSTGIDDEEQIRLIEQSPLFQPEWYLQQYADVALAGINPATHYLYSGAQEGRDPGPEFRTSEYMAAHPDLGPGGLNPLVHHLQSQPARHDR